MKPQSGSIAKLEEPLWEGDLIWDSSHQHFGTVDLIDDEHSLVHYVVMGSTTHVIREYWTGIDDVTKVDQTTALPAAPKPRITTKYGRMVDDLIHHRPKFTVEGDALFWSDYDESCYRVEMDLMGIK